VREARNNSGNSNNCFNLYDNECDTASTSSRSPHPMRDASYEYQQQQQANHFNNQLGVGNGTNSPISAHRSVFSMSFILMTNY
jgi:hypothetical protein